MLDIHVCMVTSYLKGKSFGHKVPSSWFDENLDILNSMGPFGLPSWPFFPPLMPHDNCLGA
jgi:hypothetical protein